MIILLFYYALLVTLKCTYNTLHVNHDKTTLKIDIIVFINYLNY